jgi:hypothetical protein
MAALPTQGTDTFVMVPSLTAQGTCEVLNLGCVTSVDPGSDSADQIEIPCLNNRTTKEYMAGLTTPGAGSIVVNLDPRSETHLRLFDLSKTKEVLAWAIGFADGPETDVPSVAQGGSISSVTVTDGGEDYTSAPTIVFSGGGGTGAVATATVSGGTVTAVTITNPGAGYTSPPTVSFTGGDGTGATATVTLSGGCEFDLPDTRTWVTFSGYISGFSFGIPSNNVVQATISLQRSGETYLIPKE